MSIRKGVVLEIDGHEAIVLTDSGEFTRVPLRRRQLEVGMEITLPSHRTSRSFHLRSLSGWVAAAAAVMVMAFSPLGGLFNSSGDEVVAYVNIDINPSIELAVNSKQDVVAAEPFNNDGRQVLSELDVRGKDMEEATALITEQAIKDGFLGPKASNSVMIALTPAQGETISSSWENNLKASVRNVLLEEHQVATVDSMVGSQELRLSARKQGLSVGKFAVLLAARERNLPITVAEVKQKSITEIIKDKGAQAVDLITTKHTTTDWDVIAAKFDDKLDEGTQVALAAPKEASAPNAGGDTADVNEATKPTAKQVTPGELEKDPPGMATITSFNHTRPVNTTQDQGTSTKPGEQSGTQPEGTVVDKVYSDKVESTTGETTANTQGEPENVPITTP
ncbi:MAG TPA: anti-sigma factor domain-containing protein [Bacillota bacterium]|nr:anti-sigma factor domain-containing protein [Bacillota bacterium]